MKLFPTASQITGRHTHRHGMGAGAWEYGVSDAPSLGSVMLRDKLDAMPPPEVIPGGEEMEGVQFAASLLSAASTVRFSFLMDFSITAATLGSIMAPIISKFIREITTLPSLLPYTDTPQGIMAET